MHMADALLSPAVGVTMWAASATTVAYCSKKVRVEMDDRRIPLMGVLGAFVFATQLVNFTIPVTGSSGHLGGGLILSILLGPYAAFLTISSVLVIQAFFFADGGLLALGCNMFNLGFIPAFIAYPLVYKKTVGAAPSPARISTASMAAAIVALQLGAFGVVVETVTSGISSLPFSTFVVFMQPVHLAIGVTEGLVTASVINFVYKARPEIMPLTPKFRPTGSLPTRDIVLGFLAVAMLMGGGVSLLASEKPDGLEWSIMKTARHQEISGSEPRIRVLLAVLQGKLSFLPGYALKKPTNVTLSNTTASSPLSAIQNNEQKKYARGVATSLSGIIGGTMALGLSLLIGFVLRRRGQAT